MCIRDSYITDIGYYPHACFHYRKRNTEEATEFILIYCMEGEGWFELDKHRYAVTANQFFILPKHQAHAYGSNERNPWTLYWIHFNGTKAAFFSAGFDRPKDITPQEDSRIKERLVLFEEIYSSISSGSVSYTHLDVYKRQTSYFPSFFRRSFVVKHFSYHRLIYLHNLFFLYIYNNTSSQQKYEYISDY